MSRYYCITCRGTFEEKHEHSSSTARTPAVTVNSTDSMRSARQSNTKSDVRSRRTSSNMPRLQAHEAVQAAKATVRAAAPAAAAAPAGMKIRSMPVERAKEEVVRAPRKKRDVVPRKEIFSDGSFIAMRVCAFCSAAYGQETITEHRVHPERGPIICRDCLT